MEHGNYDIILFGHNIKVAVFSRAAASVFLSSSTSVR